MEKAKAFRIASPKGLSLKSQLARLGVLVMLEKTLYY
jgi:hypothetical protein